MSEMSYIGVIERYRQYREDIQGLMGSILSGISDQRLFDQNKLQVETINSLGERYPFVELLYTLDKNGEQLSDNLSPPGRDFDFPGEGRDRSQRPYFLLAKEQNSLIVTEPYLSNASHRLCVSAVVPVKNHDGKTIGYLALDINLAKIIEFLMGDTARRRFSPLFKSIYSVIALGLFAVVGLLLYASVNELVSFVLHSHDRSDKLYLQPFSIIIYLTLGLAIFDLAKTTLEEEVLMHKDIFRHSSTRRTITRFIAAILIAVSIEALLLMFKSALSGGEELTHAVWMMFSAVGLLVGLGIYVYLGAKAEATLMKLNKEVSEG